MGTSLSGSMHLLKSENVLLPWKLQPMSPDNLPAMVDGVPFNMAIQITAGAEADPPRGILHETL